MKTCKHGSQYKSYGINLKAPPSLVLAQQIPQSKAVPEKPVVPQINNEHLVVSV
jgi:hypothetical protein